MELQGHDNEAMHVRLGTKARGCFPPLQGDRGREGGPKGSVYEVTYLGTERCGESMMERQPRAQKA